MAEPTLRDKIGIKPLHVFSIALGYLLFSWLISYGADVHNIFSLQGRMIARGLERPFMWYLLFMEGSPTEMLQWTFLAGTVLLSGYLSAQLAGKGYRQPSLFFLLLGIGTSIMLMEDAGNLRHQIKYYVRLVFGNTMEIGIAVELIFYALLGAVMLYAFLRFWRYPWSIKKTRYYIITGYLSYGIASIASATRHLGDWYDHAGNWLLTATGISEQLNALYIPPPGIARPIGFFIMDFLVEESIELIGASALCAAVFAFKEELDKNPEVIARLEGEIAGKTKVLF